MNPQERSDLIRARFRSDVVTTLRVHLGQMFAPSGKLLDALTEDAMFHADHLLDELDCLRETVLEMQGSSRQAGEILQEVSRRVHEGLEEDPQTDRGSATESSDARVYERAGEAWQVDSAAVREVWKEGGGASSGLLEPKVGDMALPEASPEPAPRNWVKEGGTMVTCPQCNYTGYYVT